MVLRITLLLGLCASTGGAGEMGTRSVCDGTLLLRVPLTSKTDENRCVSASGFKVSVGRFDNGWAVSVFSPDDSREENDLLIPPGEWNGYHSVAFWVLPEVEPKLWFPNRVIAVASTGHYLCLASQGAKVRWRGSTAAKPRGSLAFTAGTLAVYWRE
jgi:hypothetical protein